MIHTSRDNLTNEFAELYSFHSDLAPIRGDALLNHDGSPLYFTYDPIEDGHFYVQARPDDTALSRALALNAPGDNRTIAVGDGADESLAAFAEVVDSVPSTERLLRDLFSNRPKQHTVVYIEDPTRVVLVRTGKKTPVDTVVASEVNRGLLTALLAQNPKHSGVSIILRSTRDEHPSVHRVAERPLLKARDRFGYTYERGSLYAPSDKNPFDVRFTGQYGGLDERARTSF